MVMQIYAGPIVTLEHVRLAMRHIVAQCPRCGWLAQNSPWSLECHLKTPAEKLMPYRDLGRRICCKRCKRKGVTLTHTQNVLEQWTDAITWANHIRAAEKVKADAAFVRDTAELLRSYEAAGWI